MLLFLVYIVLIYSLNCVYKTYSKYIRMHARLGVFSHTIRYYIYIFFENSFFFVINCNKCLIKFKKLPFYYLIFEYYFNLCDKILFLYILFFAVVLFEMKIECWDKKEKKKRKTICILYNFFPLVSSFIFYLNFFLIILFYFYYDGWYYN